MGGPEAGLRAALGAGGDAVTGNVRAVRVVIATTRRRRGVVRPPGWGSTLALAKAERPRLPKSTMPAVPIEAIPGRDD
jgi:hypothetical protein